METTYIETPSRSYNAAVPADLADKVGYAVKLGADDNTVELATNIGEAIGTIQEISRDGRVIAVRPYGSQGSFVASIRAAVAKGGRVTVGAGGQYQAATTGHSVGFVNAAGSAGDLVEVVADPRTV